MGKKAKKVLKVVARIAVGATAIVLTERLLTPRIDYWLYKHGHKEYGGESDYCPFDFCDECPGCGTHEKEET